MVALGALLATTATPHAQQSAALRGGLDTELAGGRPGAGPAVRDRARAQPVRRGPPGAGVAPRPRLQNFRSLEKAPNTAVVAPRPVTPTPDEAGAVPRVRPPEITAGLPPVPVPRRRRTAEADPYAPLGIGIGSLRLFPAEETAVGYTDNATGGSGRQKKGSVLYRAGGDLRLQSDWSRHEFTAEARGAYTWYPAVDEADRPNADARARLRLDVTRDTEALVELRGQIDSERPGSINLPSSVRGRPLVYRTGASVGGTQRFNRLAITATALLDRTDYANGRLRDGSPLDQGDRNLTSYGLRLRTGYEITPGIQPFIETLVDTRQYDRKLDAAGLRRSSDGVQVKAGTTFELSRLLTGEVAAGYGLRRYDDPRLPDLRGPLAEAALTWAATPLTTLRLRGITEFEETIATNSSGALTRRLSLELSHAFLRNLVGTATASAERSDFQGASNRVEDTYRTGLGLDYTLNRHMVLRGSWEYERIVSNQPGEGVSSNIFLFGLRVRY